MYLIPKNIKTKKEIFKGFGILEILIMGISFFIGFIVQSFFDSYKIKIFVTTIFPLFTFLLLLPLPNGSTPFIIFRKFLIYQKRQKIYKIYEI